MALHKLARCLTATLSLAAVPIANAQFYKISSSQEIKDSTTTLAYDLMTLYPGNQTGKEPGILPGPPSENKGDYYWWEGGALMGTMIDYWHFTGHTEYNDEVTQGILYQVGENADFQPLSKRASLGNDDQGFWGMTAMLAAETNFPNPPKDKPQWLALAQAVWTTQNSPERHDDKCGGGMRWQIPPLNAGYDYKNTIANAIYMNLGARLARYTGNTTYSDAAEKTYDWLWSVNYIDHDTYKVYDGGHVEHNCTDINKAQFSYSIAVLTQATAFLWNITSNEKWKTATTKLTESLLRDFFADGAAFELPCETTPGGCTADMLSFKGYVHRWMSVVTQVAPFTAATVIPALKKSAEACIKQCTGGPTGRACGFYWTRGTYIDPSVDKTTGAGERMDALAAVSSLLVSEVAAPLTGKDGGTSQGNPNAGIPKSNDRTLSEITSGDKAGASFLTLLTMVSAASLFGWMSWDSR
ncbi:hypothetical protein MCOR27_007692 [Pyricularia oryzae]|uniref:Mannan endo-1,6-alpha-mannosidase n=2 Tax=Pyricularia TaxID=48558 RepID=A0ABQ8NY77_PYRGI|nr:hypothetical protein MCOR01_000295 [Pyricularia oryzae]KAI6303829.1 hypothetical protein MCOR33_001001 [Pyricularia grisea]KAH9427989.1 hypothetical protein MCOR02_011481 [Pyricularia oryzae]KAI6256036.1 hypothetical protein MCOR19_007521 [Pyricularia oryzae]KAI6273135.1 hypothetical protein MCOR26_007052 [Pyricularia oryzae]